MRETLARVMLLLLLLLLICAFSVVIYLHILFRHHTMIKWVINKSKVVRSFERANKNKEKNMYEWNSVFRYIPHRRLQMMVFRLFRVIQMWSTRLLVDSFCVKPMCPFRTKKSRVNRKGCCLRKRTTWWCVQWLGFNHNAPKQTKFKNQNEFTSV